MELLKKKEEEERLRKKAKETEDEAQNETPIEIEDEPESTDVFQFVITGGGKEKKPRENEIIEDDEVMSICTEYYDTFKNILSVYHAHKE